jgi:hypothetical protein
VAPPARDGWKTNGNLLHEDAEKRCAAEEPKCRWPFADYRVPESPCARQGTRCIDAPARSSGQWFCGCHQCAGDSDCAKGQYCAPGGAPCARERNANSCRDGPRPPPVDCFKQAIP